ncbi:MAG: DUF1015 family protein, partial [Chloroflexi bacterium]|nr:DUF1015 family protein [Chloroflexota bacterium]
AKEDLYVADGHHRYETALTYRNLVKPAHPDDAPNFVMAALIAFDDAGLLSLPYHRVARLTAAQAKSLRSLAAKHFTVQEHPAAGPDQIEEMANAVEQGSVLLALSDGGVKVLTLRPKASARSLLPRERSAAWRDLTVAVLHQALLDPALGLDAEAAYKAGALDYLKEPGEALQRLQSGAWQLAVFVPPVPLASLKAVADAGDRMPPKSTYFYPKLTTGLVINRLE